MKNRIPKTYSEAMAMGYHEADTTWQRGYVSRMKNKCNNKVRIAGGHRKGQLYILIPSDTSTQFCMRQYLTK